MDEMKCVSALDFVKDWNTWRTTLKAGDSTSEEVGGF
jgi:hypothetical protein